MEGSVCGPINVICLATVGGKSKSMACRIAISTKIYKIGKKNGEYRSKNTFFGRETIDARVLILGCLAILKQDMTFKKTMEHVCDTSKSMNHAFLFYQFIYWFQEEYTSEWIRFPSTDEAAIALVKEDVESSFCHQNDDAIP